VRLDFFRIIVVLFLLAIIFGICTGEGSDGFLDGLGSMFEGLTTSYSAGSQVFKACLVCIFLIFLIGFFKLISRR